MLKEHHRNQWWDEGKVVRDEKCQTECAVDPNKEFEEIKGRDKFCLDHLCHSYQSKGVSIYILDRLNTIYIWDSAEDMSYARYFTHIAHIVLQRLFHCFWQLEWFIVLHLWFLALVAPLCKSRPHVTCSRLQTVAVSATSVSPCF